MATTWTDAELNAEADWKAGRIDAVGVHTGDPGTAGTLLEASGGSPAYARVGPSFNTAGTVGSLGTAQPATVGVAWGEATVNLPAGDYTFLSLWGSGTFRGSVPLPVTVSLASQGTQSFSFPLGPSV